MLWLKWFASRYFLKNFNMAVMVTSLILERNHLTALNGTNNSEPAIGNEASHLNEAQIILGLILN